MEGGSREVDSAYGVQPCLARGSGTQIVLIESVPLEVKSQACLPSASHHWPLAEPTS